MGASRDDRIVVGTRRVPYIEQSRSVVVKSQLLLRVKAGDRRWWRLPCFRVAKLCFQLPKAPKLLFTGRSGRETLRAKDPAPSDI